jgi:hypothetical protein
VSGRITQKCKLDDTESSKIFTKYATRPDGTWASGRIYREMSSSGMGVRTEFMVSGRICTENAKTLGFDHQKDQG